jgi:hypothetical protein
VISSTVIVLVGLVAGVIGAQLAGFRFGGVVTIPVVAVYSLHDFATLPMFVLSVAVAYLLLAVIKRHILIYGRPLFVLSVVAGALVPALALWGYSMADISDAYLVQYAFLGSILPGVAAYNFHRIGNPRKRRLDAMGALGLAGLLIGFGTLLVSFIGHSPLANVGSPVLLGPSSDIATALGVVVDRPSLIGSVPDQFLLGLVAFGVLIAEAIRSRYGLRLGGVAVVPIMVLIGFHNEWLLFVWAITTVVSFVCVQLTHRWTLLYGRVLLSVSIAAGLSFATAVMFVAPVQPEAGFFLFFTGIFGGVTAYNGHVIPPADRRAATLILVSAFVMLAAIGRLFVVPLQAGFLRPVSGWHLLAGSLVAVPGCWELLRLERTIPRKSARPSISPVEREQHDSSSASPGTVEVSQ